MYKIIIDDQINQKAVSQFRENSSWYIALGIGLIALGVLAIIYAFASTIYSVIYLGLILSFIGLFEIVHSFTISRWGNFFVHLFLGILYLVGGIFIVLNPAINALTLTLLLAIFFVVSGIVKITVSIIKATPHRGLLFFNGLITLILGILIWQQWPFSGLWVIGTFIGIDAIFTGWTWIMLSIMAKNIKTEQINHEVNRERFH